MSTTSEVMKENEAKGNFRLKEKECKCRSEVKHEKMSRNCRKRGTQKDVRYQE